jgi:pimeloyl-ACP methyl ester carboxylesterase
MTLIKSAAAAGLAAMASLGAAQASDLRVQHRYEQVGDVKVFYREAGNRNAPTVLLLHGYAASSFMYRGLIPLLADKYHVIAPDLPGFGFTEAPAREKYAYTFDQLAKTIGQFTEQLKLERYAMQVFDYGAPVGWRLAAAHPSRITAIISQNGNAYEEGLGGLRSRITGRSLRRRTGTPCASSPRRHPSSGSMWKAFATKAW